VILKGIKIFNDGDYFAAHDFFEDLWHSAESKNRNFFQGLTQLSVSCFHFVSGNFSGSLSQLEKAKTKLLQYLPDYMEINLTQLLSDINIFETEIKIQLNTKTKTVNYAIIPVIKLQQNKGAISWLL